MLKNIAQTENNVALCLHMIWVQDGGDPDLIHHHQHIHRSAMIGLMPVLAITDHPSTIVNHEQEVARHSDQITNCLPAQKGPTHLLPILSFFAIFLIFLAIKLVCEPLMFSLLVS